MKVQQIRQSITLEGLEDWRTAGLPGTPEISVSGAQRMIPGAELSNEVKLVRICY